MKVDNGRKKPDLSAWTVLSAVAVLALILLVMAHAQFKLRENQAVSVFIEKGTTLIASFEAGMRIGALPAGDDIFRLQKLLMQTAQQPDIDHIIVTDDAGNVLADSDPAMLDTKYGLDLEMAAVGADRQIRWRQTANPGGAGTFEVYRGFLPDGGANRIIYVGFNMSKIEKAAREDKLHTVIISVGLALIGSLAIVSLFLVQAYRLARASLSRMTVFSETLVKNMPLGVLALDFNRRVVTCNEQVRDLLPCACDEALGRPIDELVAGPFVELFDGLASSEAFMEKDITLTPARKGRSEPEIWEAMVAWLRGKEGPDGKVLLVRNVTALRRMEKEVARSRHLNALGSLAAGVAHEIRNPLSSIKGFAVYFKQRLSGNREDEETADIMIAEIERLNRVIGNLIEFARPLVLKTERTNLHALAARTLRLIESEALKNAVTLELKSEAALPEAQIDPDKVQQVFLNIFLNALSAMPQGGRLSIALSLSAHGVKVEISDTGSGISDEDLPRIYDPYFTTKPAGTGLGLAVVQKIMDAHGGSVQIESRAGAGTKVGLRFAANHKEGATS